MRSQTIFWKCIIYFSLVQTAPDRIRAKPAILKRSLTYISQHVTNWGEGCSMKRIFSHLSLKHETIKVSLTFAFGIANNIMLCFYIIRANISLNIPPKIMVIPLKLTFCAILKMTFRDVIF